MHRFLLLLRVLAPTTVQLFCTFATLLWSALSWRFCSSSIHADVLCGLKVLPWAAWCRWAIFCTGRHLRFLMPLCGEQGFTAPANDLGPLMPWCGARVGGAPLGLYWASPSLYLSKASCSFSPVYGWWWFWLQASPEPSLG